MLVYVYVNGRQLKVTDQGTIGFTGGRLATFSVTTINRPMTLVSKIRMASKSSGNLSPAVYDMLTEKNVKITYARVKPNKFDADYYRQLFKAKMERKAEKRQKWIRESLEELAQIEKEYKKLKAIVNQ